MAGHIVSDPAILGGKPCIRGTRISVEFLLELVASGAANVESPLSATSLGLNPDSRIGEIG